MKKWKATTLDKLVESYFVQAACVIKQADVHPVDQEFHPEKFHPRGKAFNRIADREFETNHPDGGACRVGTRRALAHLKTLKREKWERRWDWEVRP